MTDDKVYQPVTAVYQNDGTPVSTDNPFPVAQSAQPLPVGAATAENQTNGTQKTLMVDLDGHIVNVQRIDASTAGDEYGAIVISMIHGKSTAGGGSWVDVKVSPSGAIQIGGTIDTVTSLPLPAGAATSANQTNKSQYVRITDGVDDAAVIAGAFTGEKGLRVFGGPTDPVSDIPVGIDFGHHQRHEGETHRAEYFDQSLDTNTVKFALTVPVYASLIHAPHLLIMSEVYNGSLLVRIYEGATFTGGSDLPSKNANRNSLTTPGMTIKSGVTSTDGTLLPFSHYVGAGSREAGSRATDEILLKSNTVYRVDLIGLTAGTDAILHFEWYEDLGV